MTGSQRLVLMLGMVLLAGCLLYPPWHVRVTGVTLASSGYAFLFSAPPQYRGRPRKTTATT